MSDRGDPNPVSPEYSVRNMESVELPKGRTGQDKCQAKAETWPFSRLREKSHRSLHHYIVCLAVSCCDIPFFHLPIAPLSTSTLGHSEWQ